MENIFNAAKLHTWVQKKLALNLYTFIDKIVLKKFHFGILY